MSNSTDLSFIIAPRLGPEIPSLRRAAADRAAQQSPPSDKGGISAGGAEEYELQEYQRTEVQQSKEKTREQLRQAKRDEKRRWLDAQDEMKFSHSIQFNAVPDWSTHYIAYSNLKKIIYQLEKVIHQSGGGDTESRPLLQNDDPDTIFIRALDVELEKISSFYSVKEHELFEEVDQLLRDIGAHEDGQTESDGTLPTTPNETLGRTTSVQSASEDGQEDSDEEGDETTGLTGRKRRSNSFNRARRRSAGGAPTATDMTASTEITRFSRRQSTTNYDDYAEQAVLFSSGIMLKRRIISLYVSLCELKSYSQLNRTGFRKVLKKYDKILDRQLQRKYMDSFVNTAYVFQPDTIQLIEEKIARIEEAYAKIVTNGDMDLARKDLRSHLREHVVWERNTVWREMIGMERRAEAASLGHTLLGRDNDPKHRLLQGDDEIIPPVTEIKTPIGRFVCPTWLVGSTMFTLTTVIAIFLALLYIPILDKPEQQNCLAMLVFVSLLWATEAIPLFVTSLLIPFLCVVLNVVREDAPPYARLSSADATKYVFSSMWSSVIMLLLGGFTVAAALSKCRIDKRIATFVLSKAGTQPRTVVLANMLVAAFASMLISNVAAPVLCFGIIEPMLRNLPNGSDMSKAVIMGIALASNIGGMLSPIASPQNVVALSIMKPAPSWGQWFYVVIPVGLLSIVLIWLLLLLTFQPGKGTVIVPIRPVQDPFTSVQWFVTIVTITTIALWCASSKLEDIFGDMGVIAILPIVLFFGIGILTKEDFNNFPWTIIILASGGLALGKAVRSSGLLDTMAIEIGQQVRGMGLYGVLVVFSSLILVIATFISHTVAAMILLPLVYDVGQNMETDEPHPNLLVMAGVLMCSAAMALPTSGFPNMSEYSLGISASKTLKLTLADSCNHEGGSCWTKISTG